MIHYSTSNEIQPTDTIYKDDIHIFCQFFIHNDPERHAEILKCLKYNVDNPYITNIYLLNENMYSFEELGTNSDKIIQFNIQRRLRFADVFQFINEHQIGGYNVIINSDIFFDHTLQNLYMSGIHQTKRMFALLRYEYDDAHPEQTHLFGPRADSQDTWIIHSNFSIQPSELKLFQFEFGKPGCDNKLVYLMQLLGYEVINEPTFIKTYHYHATQMRNYTQVEQINPPYSCIMPKKTFDGELDKDTQFKLDTFFRQTNDPFYSNHHLYQYIDRKLQRGEHFTIPRISSIESIYAVYFSDYKGELPSDKSLFQLTLLNNTNTTTMKTTTGILLKNRSSATTYSNMYLHSFTECEMYGSWPKYHSYVRSAKGAHEFICGMCVQKDTYQAEALDVYHFIKGVPWTHALKGKRLLMVCSFDETVREKIHTRKEIYGMDLFPDCEIITLKPPQTHASLPSRPFEIEMLEFMGKLTPLLNQFDVALVSAGGYGNLICSAIYRMGKSAICVGGVLQMYWGIMGKRWLLQVPDVLRLYLNAYWTRPKPSETPDGHEQIENGCFW